MSDYRKRMTTFVENALGQHQMTGVAPSRSWTFQRVTENGSRWCPYGFKLTWTPGTIALMGDIGDLQLTHYHAIVPDTGKSMRWLADADLEYLMEKSNRSKEYDPEATFKLLWELLTDDLRTAVAQRHQDLRDWLYERKTDPEAERSTWIGEGDVYEDLERIAVAVGFVEFKDCAGWARTAWRRHVRSLLIEQLHEGGYRAAEISYAVFDEPVVCMSWPRHCEMQIAAMQFAALWVLEHECQAVAA